MERDLSKKQDFIENPPSSQDKQVRKYVRIYSQENMRAQGIKALQAPSTYILAILASFVLYYVDKRYRLENVLEDSKRVLVEAKEGMISDKSDIHASIDTQWVLLFSVLFLSFVLALKRAYNKRRIAREAEKQEEIQEQEGLVNQQSGSIFGDSRRQARHSRIPSACEQISKEEYDYQTNIVTRNEIHKLVNSSSYKNSMNAKGAEVEKWNWQALDRQNGIYPQDEAELQEIQESSKEQKRDSSSKKQQSVSPFRERQLNFEKSASKQGGNFQSTANQRNPHGSTQVTKRQSSGKRTVSGFVAGNENSGANDDSISKHLSFDSPNMKNRKEPTPTAKQYCLRSSPYILRSTLKSLQ